MTTSLTSQGGGGFNTKTRFNQLLMKTKLLIGQSIAFINQSKHLKSDSTADVNK